MDAHRVYGGETGRRPAGREAVIHRKRSGDMFGAKILQTRTVTMMDKTVTVSIYMRHNGRCFATTFFSDKDIIITDGISLEETFERHTKILPIAIKCRKAAYEFCCQP